MFSPNDILSEQNFTVNISLWSLEAVSVLFCFPSWPFGKFSSTDGIVILSQEKTTE